MLAVRSQRVLDGRGGNRCRFQPGSGRDPGPRDKVKYTPSEVRYKVYIVDEVHMLTAEAFNALLKTLEEPPGHALFILATTEPHKLPSTIISRCQRFSFRRHTLGNTLDTYGRSVIPKGFRQRILLWR